MVKRRQHRSSGVIAAAAMGDNMEITWTLLAAASDDVVKFYEKMGFERSADAMERRGRL
jgi:hypothetical protein